VVKVLTIISTCCAVASVTVSRPLSFILKPQREAAAPGPPSSRVRLEAALALGHQPKSRSTCIIVPIHVFGL